MTCRRSTNIPRGRRTVLTRLVHLKNQCTRQHHFAYKILDLQACTKRVLNMIILALRWLGCLVHCVCALPLDSSNFKSASRGGYKLNSLTTQKSHCSMASKCVVTRDHLVPWFNFLTKICSLHIRLMETSMLVTDHLINLFLCLLNKYLSAI